MPVFVIRADASATIGTGHIMRCLALAAEIKKQGGTVIFVVAQCPPALAERIKNEGYQFLQHDSEIKGGSAGDAQKLLALLAINKPHTVIVDGYHFLTDYQKSIRQAGYKLLYIDDLAHCQKYDTYYLLNQNAGAEATQYRQSAPDALLLLGPGYVLMRETFAQMRESGQKLDYPARAKNILVTMGGGDIENVTAVVMKALAETPAAFELNVTVIVGGANPHADAVGELAGLLSANTAHAFSLLVDVKNMAEKLVEADLVISAGGTTVWEAACLARPVAVVITADNQKAGMGAFAAQGAIKLLGEASGLNPQSLSNDLRDLILDKEGRRATAHRAASLIDGEGAARVVQTIWPDK